MKIELSKDCMLRHILGWLFITMYLTVADPEKGPFLLITVFTIMMMTSYIIVYYTYYFFILPKFYQRNVSLHYIPSCFL
ncbi:MAG TPA: hypothetical protein VLB84_14540, partial [Bacteroidia bacterium]|nr:hypothetical protein [Bacteroidia bacterium]